MRECVNIPILTFFGKRLTNTKEIMRIHGNTEYSKVKTKCKQLFRMDIFKSTFIEKQIFFVMNQSTYGIDSFFHMNKLMLIAKTQKIKTEIP